MAHAHTTITPWLRRNQWALFCSVYADPHELPASYDDWLRDAEHSRSAFTQVGYRVQQVDVDVDQLMAWCRKRGQRLDGQALILFSTERGAS